MSNQEKVVYVPMSCEILHPGHIKMIQTAAKYGKVVVGLLTDDVISSFKREFHMNYDQREFIVSNIKGVDEVVSQKTRSYEENLRKLKPDYMIHGKDWQKGPLAKDREEAIKIMAEWGGEVIEPDYTDGVSTALIQENVFNHVKWDKELTVGG